MMTHAQVIHAEEVTARLRDEEPPFDLAPREAICHRCHLAYWVHAEFSWGRCPDCLADVVAALPID